MPSISQSVPAVDPKIQAACQAFRRDYRALQSEIAKAIVGHEAIIDGALRCLFCGGHALLEGVPGLGKTALASALAQALDLKFNRIQFTPDLMPADILGTNCLVESEDGKRSFTFLPGPIFTQILLADEINRATPKTQSALLEAMQEKQVTAGGQIRKLAPPFFVLATQNPLEHEGTYPLPEAQLDRFFFKLLMEYSDREELHQILDMTTADHRETIEPVLDGARLLAHQELIRQVPIARHVQDYAIRCVLATHPTNPLAVPMSKRYLRVGASPRAAQAMVLAAKVSALLDGRFHVSCADLKEVALPAMRHRVILNFEAEANGIGPDEVLREVLERTPTS
jgi:MoxR-like ATPase